MEYELTEKALKDIKQLPKDIQKRIIFKLDYFVSQEKPLTHAEKLINFALGEYRFRIGDYRVIFDKDEETLIILRIGHRKEIYK